MPAPRRKRSRELTDQYNGSTVAQALRRLAGIRDLGITVGVQGTLAAQAHPDSDVTNVDIAVFQEFGTRASAATAPDGTPLNFHVPPRPFLRSTFAMEHRKWNRLLMRETRKYMLGKVTLVALVGRVGARAKADVQQRIVDIDSPALARPRADGSDNPLVDTGALKASITFKAWANGRVLIAA